jgi:hypothetical protein
VHGSNVISQAKDHRVQTAGWFKSTNWRQKVPVSHKKHHRTSKVKTRNASPARNAICYFYLPIVWVWETWNRFAPSTIHLYFSFLFAPEQQIVSQENKVTPIRAMQETELNPKKPNGDNVESIFFNRPLGTIPPSRIDSQAPLGGRPRITQIRAKPGPNLVNLHTLLRRRCLGDSAC